MENYNTAANELISEEDLKRWEAEKWQRQWRVLTESQAIEEMREIFKHSFDGNITGRRQLLSDLKGQCPTIADFQFEKLWKSVLEENWAYYSKRYLKKIAEITSLPAREDKLKQIAARFEKPAKEIREALTAYIAEEETKENRADTLKELDQILNATKSRLDLNSVIPDSLAKPINLLASTLNLRPECYLTTMLSVTSSLFKTGTKVRLLDCTDFEVVPNLFGAIVAVPSQYKSPIIKAIASKPLNQLQKNADLEFERVWKDYEEQMAEYESLSEEEQKERSKPKAPPNRKRVVKYKKATSEAVREQYAAYPNCGLLNLVDELKGAFSSFNQYRKGKGSDEEDLLELYDGTGETVLRVDAKKCADLPDDLIFAVMGGIQPKVLQGLLQDCTDDNGKWARFNFVVQPMAASQINDDSGKVDLTSMLAGLYEKIDHLPAITYSLTPEAKKCFLKARNHAELKRVEDPRPGMQAVWGKVAGKLGKFALNLHVIEELMRGREPSLEIPLERMKAAVELAKFYVDQVESLYVEFASPSELTPALAKILQLSERRGWVKARDVQNNFDKKNRPIAEKVRDWFTELVAMGRGEVRGKGRAIEFSYRREFVGVVGETPTNSPTSESIENTRFQPFVGVVGDVGDFPPSPESLEENNLESLGNSLPLDFLSEKENTVISPTTPAIPTNGQDVVLKGIPAVGEVVGVSPTTEEIPAELDRDAFEAYILAQPDRANDSQAFGTEGIEAESITAYESQPVSEESAIKGTEDGEYTVSDAEVIIHAIAWIWNALDSNASLIAVDATDSLAAKGKAYEEAGKGELWSQMRLEIKKAFSAEQWAKFQALIKEGRELENELLEESTPKTIEGTSFSTPEQLNLDIELPPPPQKKAPDAYDLGF